jgi:hypothetical protein
MLKGVSVSHPVPPSFPKLNEDADKLRKDCQQIADILSKATGERLSLIDMCRLAIAFQCVHERLSIVVAQQKLTKFEEFLATVEE